MHKKISSLLLVFCMLLSMIPFGGTALAAGDEKTIHYEANDQASLLNALTLIKESDDTSAEHEILITSGFPISQTISFPTGKKIVLRGGNDPLHEIVAAGELLTSGGAMFVVPKYESPTTFTISICGLNLNANASETKSANVRIIEVGKNARLIVGGTRTILQGGYVSGAGNGGAAIAAASGSIVYAYYVNFTNNIAEPLTASGGGAVFLSNAAGHFRECGFNGNEAHSGGAIYFFGGGSEHIIDGQKITGMPLLVDTCAFENNKADQRGGAIHCHGNAYIHDAKFHYNTSNQNGGAIFISSQNTNDGVRGKMILQNTKISGNSSGSSGGGIYIADGGTLYLAGSETTVSANVMSSEIVTGHRNSNVFYSGAGCKIIVGSNVSRYVGPNTEGIHQGGVGVSTINPYTRKLAVYSAKEVKGSDEMEALDKLIASIHALNWERDNPFQLSTSYSMADTANYQNYKNFFYDSEVWHLVTKKFETNDQELKELFDASPEPITNSDVKEGNMWLNLDPKYIQKSTGSTTTVTVKAPCVIFDLNVPGGKATIYDNLAVGTTVGIPTATNRKEQGVNFTFKGWYDQPSGGTKLTEPITVTKDMGIKVYYAQWDISSVPVPTPVPGLSKMFLIYYDKNYDGGGITASYNVAGDFSFTVKYEFTKPDGEIEKGSQVIPVEINWGWPGDPYREGYTFAGWSLSDHGATVNTATWTPTQPVMTLYAQWTPNPCEIVWDAKGGSGGATVTVGYGSIIEPPKTPPTRPGYSFGGWYLSEEYELPLTVGTKATGNAAFYAKWIPNEYTITWDANYTGGGITTITQYYDQALKIPADPVRHGYEFNGWLEKDDNTYANPNGTVTGSKTYIAQWGQNKQDYTVTVEWRDFNDNDAVRPESIHVTLMQNGIPMTDERYRQPIDAKMAVEGNKNKWTYTFEGLPETDVVSNPITYSVAITSSVPDEYVYRVENNSKTAGYILLTHALITRDVDAYVVWDDNSNQDGIRPAAVTVQLRADGNPMKDTEYRVTLSGSGNTWFYRFHDVQKYCINAEGNKGTEIIYDIRAFDTDGNELTDYKAEYRDYTAILSYTPATVSRQVLVEWQDNNDQDGKRPAAMAVQLYADNVPLEGKVVLLSDANNWTYTWDELPKFADGGRQVTYSARVTSTLVDYTAKSAGMTIEMTYVPSSTSISAFVTWTDENDADGLRPDYITAELVADGKATGDRQVLSATNGWTMTWNNYPIYKDGKRIEYTFKVDAPDGYEAAYHGVYDTSGLSAVLTHARLKQSLTGNIVWEDRNNQSGGRMSRVAVQLYADGVVIDEDDKVWISADEGWEHTFSNLPIYRDGGEEIKYSMVLVSDPGKYVPTTSKMTITMRLEPEYVDVPFQIIWDDNNNSDGQRPGYVAVTLLVDGKPSQYGQTATAQTDWAADFTHLDRYGANGLYSYKAQLVAVPEGYTATYTSADVVVLKRVAETKNVTATVIWQDNDDQYGQRPGQVTLTLYADRLDGNGPQNTGRVEKCKAADGWEFTFEDVPAYHGGKNIIYSVVVSGNLPNYTISYDGMDVYMTHEGYIPTPVTIDYTANVVWHDGHNAKGSRPYNVLVTLYANGEEWDSHTLTEGDLDNTGYTWNYTFKKLPAKMSGKDVVYTIGITELNHYTAQAEGNTITLTHVMDIPILLRWADQRNNDGVRPSALTLNLYGDATQTGTTLTLTGGSTAETWRDSFRQIPVWSEGLLDHEIVYTWAFAENSLANNGYSVDFNGYSTATVDNEAVYPIDIARPGEVTDVAATILWDDNTDQDGLRPASHTVRLYADGVDTGKAITLKGGNEDENWRDKFTALPVWRDGQRIQYSIEAEALEDYTATSVPGDPLTLMMTHEPFMDDIIATLVWMDETLQGGLTRFPISMELNADGPNLAVEAKTVSIGESAGKHEVTVTWEDVPVYYDHGKVYKDFTVQATAVGDKPTDHIISVEGLTVTVKRVEFQLTGRVLKSGNVPIPTILVTLSDMTGKLLDQTYTDKDGNYAFTVSPGSYNVRATVALPWSSLYQNVEIKDLCSDTIQDFTFSQQIPICECRIVVKRSNGAAANGAEVYVVRPSQAYSTTLTTNADGVCNVTLPHGNYYFYISYTNEKGVCYLAETSPYFYGDKQTFTITLPPEGNGAISGTVWKDAKDPVSDIVVQCYRRGDGSYVGVETKTDENGKFTLGGLIDGTYEVVLKDQSGKAIPLPQGVYFTIPSYTELNINLTDYVNEDPTPSGYGTLSGVVTDKNGQPIDKAQVVVTDKATGSLVEILTTDPDGAFEAQLPAGEYTVNIQELFDNTTDLPIHANDDEANRDDGPVTADSFTISGEVLDEDGHPKEGSTVYLYVESEQAVEAVLLELDEDEIEPDSESELDVLALGGYVRLDEMVTAADGKYVFANLPAGRYVVKIAEGIGGNGGSTDIPVIVAPIPEIPDDANLTITTDSYTVTGVVDGKAGVPVSGATVKLLDETGKEVTRLTTGKDGTYQFEALPEGDYTVNISYPDIAILATGDVTISDGSFATFPGQIVTGTIKDNKGNALPNMTVTLTDEANHTYTAITDKDGGYRVVVPDGKYTVEVNVNGKTASKAITVNGKLVSADLTVTISTETTPGGTTTPGGNTTPSGSGSSGIGGGFNPGPVEEQPTSFVLSGVVLDKDKNPVEGATVTAVNTKTGETFTETTGPDGKYALSVPKGSYSISISYGSTTTNPKKVSVSKDTALDNLTLDNAGKLVRAYVNGYADGTFGGGNFISRSEVAALISRVSADFDKDKTYSFEFEDVAEGVWYANNLGYCVQAGLIQGRGNGHFDPSANITRSEFAAIVARFSGLPNEVTGVNPYTDTAGNWAEGYIAQLTAKGIVEGKGDGKFDPSATITRYEAVTMLNRALERIPDKAVLNSLAANRTIRVFPDLVVTHWAYYQVLEAANDHYHK